MFSDENVNVINLGALGTVVLDLETTLTVLTLLTAMLLNIAKIYKNFKEAHKVSKDED